MFLTPFSYIFFVFYLCLIYLMLMVSDFYLFWMLMEMSTLVFMGLAYSLLKNSFSSLLMLFIIQTFSAFGLFLFFSVESSFMFSFFWLMKLAMFPFHFWFLGLVYFMPNSLIFVLSTFFKLPTIFLLFAFDHLFAFDLLFVSSVFTLFFGGLSMVVSMDFRYLIIGSSVCNNSWFFLAQLSSFFVFLLYWVFYSIFIFLLLKMMGFNSMSFSSSMPFVSELGFSFYLLSVSGLPPFPLFFLKMLILYNLFIFYPFFYLFFILFSTLFLLLGYLKFYFNFLLMKKLNVLMI